MRLSSGYISPGRSSNFPGFLPVFSCIKYSVFTLWEIFPVGANASLCRSCVAEREPLLCGQHIPLHGFQVTSATTHISSSLSKCFSPSSSRRLTVIARATVRRSPSCPTWWSGEGKAWPPRRAASARSSPSASSSWWTPATRSRHWTPPSDHLLIKMFIVFGLSCNF